MKNKIEIFLITYNRANYLEETLKAVTANDSPIKDFDIKILDNNSSDNTASLCQEYSSKFPNITYIKHNRNIGLSGNICRTMELVQKEYLWILCDNDEINWEYWNEVEQGIKEDNDLIIASTFYRGDKKNSKALALAQSTFLPAAIYKTKFITDSLMTYAMADIPTILPHVSMACAILNQSDKIFYLSGSIVDLTNNVKIEDFKKYSFDRIDNAGIKYTHIKTKAVNFSIGILESFSLLEDEKIKKEAIEMFLDRKKANNYGPFIVPRSVMASFIKKQIPFYFFCELLTLLPIKERLQLILNLVCPVFYKSPNGLSVTLCSLLKLRLFDYKWLGIKKRKQFN